MKYSRHLLILRKSAASEQSTLVEVNEEGFVETEGLISLLVGNKEGWVYMLTCLKGYLEHDITALRAAMN